RAPGALEAEPVAEAVEQAGRRDRAGRRDAGAAPERGPGHPAALVEAHVHRPPLADPALPAARVGRVVLAAVELEDPAAVEPRRPAAKRRDLGARPAVPEALEVGPVNRARPARAAPGGGRGRPRQAPGDRYPDQPALGHGTHLR